jgi:hypothetical protein
MVVPAGTPKIGRVNRSTASSRRRAPARPSRTEAAPPSPIDPATTSVNAAPTSDNQPRT